MSKREKKIKGLIEIEEKKSNLADQITHLAKGLNYMSETDAAIFPFEGEKAETVTAAEILRQTKNAEDTPVEERNFADFFSRLTEIQDWFGDEEKKSAEKFAGLEDLLEKNLRELKVFKIGSIQLKIYAVGLDSEDKLTGIQTEAVET